MDRTALRRSLDLAAPLALALLLVVLAVLQYRWIERLEEREREAREATAEAALVGAVVLVERELADLIRHLDRAVRTVRSGSTPDRSLLEHPWVERVFWVARGPGEARAETLTPAGPETVWTPAPWVELVQAAPGWARSLSRGGAVPERLEELVLHRNAARPGDGDPRPGVLLLRLDRTTIDRQLAALGEPPPTLRMGAPGPRSRAVSDGRMLDGQAMQGSLYVTMSGFPPDAGATSLRDRNLLISSAILLLLAASVALVWAGARRERRLARRRAALVAGVSHELRTPVAVLNQAGANLADGIVKRPEDVEEYGAVILEQSRRLGTLVEQALALGQATRSRRGAVPGRAALDQVLAEAIASIRSIHPELQEPGLPDELAGTVVALPPEELRRVIENLLMNVVRHGREGRVELRCAQAPGGGVELSLENPADPMARDEFERLGEPFFRPERSRTEQGTGLGLALVRALLEAHGATLVLEQGDECFVARLRLPRART